MTPSEINIFKSLIAVAWADGDLGAPEQDMLEGLFWAFDASEDEERQLKEFAEVKRTLADDVPLDDLNPDDRELLLAHAALLTHADGAQTQPEKKALAALVKLLGFTNDEAKPIISQARQRAARLAERL
jgi:tellurite resistance protein